MSVFSPVDRHWRGTKYRHIFFIEPHGKIIWDLTANRYYYTPRAFAFNYIKHTFDGQSAAAPAVTNIIIGTNSFRVVIYHYRSESLFLNCINCINGTPVEFNT